MKYALVIVHPPSDLESQSRTMRLGRALIENGHEVSRVFFYGDGTQIGCQDASETREQWIDLASPFDTELAICSASGEKNGVVKAPDHFVLAGLGALMESGFDCDRVITCA